MTTYAIHAQVITHNDDYSEAWLTAASESFWHEVERLALLNVCTELLA